MESDYIDSDLKSVSSIDKELEQIVQRQGARVKVIGCGGGGGNSVSRMREIGIKGCEVIAINTDAQDLLYTNADVKILIGRELTGGLGAGSNPKIGEEAARESEQEIRKRLANSDLVFITFGLGGGTGTGSAPVVADIAKKMGALVIGVVTLPFTVEGQKRIENAQYGLERFEQIADTLIVIPNDKLLELAPELPIQTAFKVADEILTNAVKGIAESDSAQNRAREAIERAINNPLLDVRIDSAKGALVNIIGGPDMSLDEYRQIMEKVSAKVAPDAKIISGAKISADMEKNIKVLLIVTGVKSSQIVGSGSNYKLRQDNTSLGEELGIKFINE